MGGSNHHIASQRIIGRYNQIVQGGGEALVYLAGKPTETIRLGRHGEPASVGGTGAVVGCPSHGMGQQVSVQANLEVALVVRCVLGLVVELHG